MHTCKKWKSWAVYDKRLGLDIRVDICTECHDPKIKYQFDPKWDRMEFMSENSASAK